MPSPSSQSPVHKVDCATVVLKSQLRRERKGYFQKAAGKILGNDRRAEDAVKRNAQNAEAARHAALAKQRQKDAHALRKLQKHQQKARGVTALRQTMVDSDMRHNKMLCPSVVRTCKRQDHNNRVNCAGTGASEAVRTDAAIDRMSGADRDAKARALFEKKAARRAPTMACWLPGSTRANAEFERMCRLQRHIDRKNDEKAAQWEADMRAKEHRVEQMLAILHAKGTDTSAAAMQAAGTCTGAGPVIDLKERQFMRECRAAEVLFQVVNQDKLKPQL